MPEVFVKVAEPKRMLQVGEAEKPWARRRIKGGHQPQCFSISIKDAVQPFQDMEGEGHIITCYAF